MNLLLMMLFHILFHEDEIIVDSILITATAGLDSDIPMQDLTLDDDQIDTPIDESIRGSFPHIVD